MDLHQDQNIIGREQPQEADDDSCDSCPLARREPLPPTASHEQLVVLADGRAVVVAADESTVAVLRVRLDPSRWGPPLRLNPGAASVTAHVAPAWLALMVADPVGLTIHLLDTLTFLERARLRLGGASRARLRLGDTRLTLSDDRGRVIAVDLDGGGLLRDLRT